MVQVRQQTHIDAQGAIDLERWLMQLPLVLEDAGRHQLLAACERVRLAQQQPAEDAGDWAHESNCFIAGLDIVLILADLHVDLDCLLAGVLYRAVREERLAQDEVRVRDVQQIGAVYFPTRTARPGIASLTSWPSRTTKTPFTMTCGIPAVAH